MVPWLGAKVEAAGADVFTGFAASEALFDDAGAVKGIRLGDMGRARDGSAGPNFTPGADIHATVTVLAEGCRGSLSKQLIARYRLDAECQHPPCAGLQGLWRCHPAAVAGAVLHDRLADAPRYLWRWLHLPPQ
jgi:electron-transferring-flavoprotein dehydrogenase